MIHILKKLPDSDRQSIKEILTIIILAVFLFQGSGIGYHLSIPRLGSTLLTTGRSGQAMNNELSTNRALRPPAKAHSRPMKLSFAESDRYYLDLDKCVYSGGSRYFYRGVQYFNEHLSGKNPITWGDIITLFEKFRGDDINPLYTPEVQKQRLESIRSGHFIDFQRLLKKINQKWPTAEEALDAAASTYVIVVGTLPETQLLVSSSFGMYGCPGLPGFDKIHELEDTGKLGHPGVGHHRLGWFLLNYVLMNNGLPPLYLKKDEVGGNGPFGVLKRPETIITPLRERISPTMNAPIRNQEILKIYRFFLHLKINLLKCFKEKTDNPAIRLLVDAGVVTEKEAYEGGMVSGFRKQYEYGLADIGEYRLNAIEGFLNEESLTVQHFSIADFSKKLKAIMREETYEPSRAGVLWDTTPNPAGVVRRAISINNLTVLRRAAVIIDSAA